MDILCRPAASGALNCTHCLHGLVWVMTKENGDVSLTDHKLFSLRLFCSWYSTVRIKGLKM